MRIFYHHRTQAEDAQGIHITEIVRSLRELGHEVAEISLVDSAEKQSSGHGGRAYAEVQSRVPNLGYELMEVAYNPVGLAMFERAARRFGRPKLIYERHALHNFVGALAAKRFRVPLVVEVNAPLAREQSETGKLTFRAPAERSERAALRLADVVIAVSTPLKEILVELGVPAAKIHVIPNGVNPDQFHGRDTGGAVRARHGLVGRRVLGFVGWIREWHGLEAMVAAMPAWPAALADVHLLVVGDGPARGRLEAAARAAGVAARVHVTGAVSRAEVVDHVAAFDVALQPAATPYASPMKLFEYLAMGKPVLAPRQPNLLEILEEGRTAVFFDSKDPGDLAEKARGLFADPERLKGMAGEARAAIFRRGFLWRRNAERAVELALGPR